MGHQHLLSLPRTRDWEAVLALLAGGGGLEAIAAATAIASQRSLVEAANDQIARYSFYLLTQLPIAARSPDFPAALRRIGVEVDGEPDLVGLGTAVMATIDRRFATACSRTDYGEIAQLAAVESIQAVLGREIGDFFDPNVRLKPTLGRFAEPRHFQVLARDFFARLTRRHLTFYLSRELAGHVGTGQRFPNLMDQEAFETALDLHCRETTRIIQEFSTGWYFKHASGGGFDHDLAGAFVHVATGKLRDELVRRSPADG